MKLFLALIVTLFIHPIAMGCWAKPKEIVTSNADSSGIYYERHNRTGTIKIYRGSGKSKKLVWRIKLQGFSQLFSKIRVFNNGKTIVHYKTNNGIHKLEDVAFAVYKKHGLALTLPVSHFTKKLIKNKGPLMSTSPQFLWLKEIKNIDNSAATILTAENKIVKLNYNELVRAQ